MTDKKPEPFVGLEERLRLFRLRRKRGARHRAAVAQKWWDGVRKKEQ
jgi:hypothetical protein